MAMLRGAVGCVRTMNMLHKILVVEDDQDLGDAVSQSLEDAGYGVSVAANGAIAMSTLKEPDDLPCVILLDLMIPVMDGENFMLEMRRDPRLPALPVIVLTADGCAPAKATALGARDGLRKPIELDELLATVSKYCDPSKHNEASPIAEGDPDEVS